jgi:hypothetical protein
MSVVGTKRTLRLRPLMSAYYTITVAIWTSFSFHLCLMWMLTIHDRPVPARRRHCIDASLSVLFLSELANVSLKPSHDIDPHLYEITDVMDSNQ